MVPGSSESPEQLNKKSRVQSPGNSPGGYGRRPTGTRRISDRWLRLEHKRHPDNILMAVLKLSSDEILGIDLFRKSIVRVRVADSSYDFYDLDDHGGSGSAVSQGTVKQQRGDKRTRTARERLQVLSLARHGESYGEDSIFPDVVTVSGEIALLGTLKRRYARKLLEGIAVPLARTLFGFAGWSVPYWDLTGDYPSVVLLERPSYIMLFLRDDGTAWARLTKSEVDMMMPVSDESIKAHLKERPNGTIEGKDIELVVGKRAYYLLTTLQPPYNGNCYKTLSTIIPT